jgi:hypothetical protein
MFVPGFFFLKKKSQEGTPDFPGVVPRAIEALFKQVVDSNHAFLFTFSMLEIYMGNLKDLLIPQQRKAMDPMPPWWDALIGSHSSGTSF